MLRYAYPRSSEGPSPETSRRRSGEWRPAAAARNRLAPGGSGPRPPGTTTWLRGARSTDPEEMPEKEARPPAQNRHGGASRGERVPPDARRASQARIVAPDSATKENLRLSALRSPLMGRMEKRKAKPGRRNAPRERGRLCCGMVIRNCAATPLVSRPSARLGADFGHDAGTRARAGTQGPHDVQRQADIALRTSFTGSRVSFRFAPLARAPRGV